MSLRFIISGTDTGIGKTVFAAALCRALNAYYWKPIQAGLEEETDSETVARLGGVPPERILPEMWKLKTPASPHLSAQIDNVQIKTQALLPPHQSPLIIEGAGGLLVPLSKDCLFADVFAQWNIPLILCARTELGTINHTLLSLEALRHRGITIQGVVFIGAEQKDTEQTIATFAKVRILGRLPFINALNTETLEQAFKQHFSIEDFKELIDA